MTKAFVCVLNDFGLEWRREESKVDPLETLYGIRLSVSGLGHGLPGTFTLHGDVVTHPVLV